MVPKHLVVRSGWRGPSPRFRCCRTWMWPAWRWGWVPWAPGGAVVAGLPLVGALAACIATAQLLLHDSWVVEALEASTLKELAVKARRQEGLGSRTSPLNASRAGTSATEARISGP